MKKHVSKTMQAWPYQFIEAREHIGMSSASCTGDHGGRLLRISRNGRSRMERIVVINLSKVNKNGSINEL